jgi:hypothetical protein
MIELRDRIRPASDIAQDGQFYGRAKTSQQEIVKLGEHER